MIISENDLNIASKVAQQGMSCQFLSHCLLGGREYKGCSICHAYHFRKHFMLNSPALYYLFRDLSGYSGSIAIKRENYLKNALFFFGFSGEGLPQSSEEESEFSDLYYFCAMFLIIAYPIYFASVSQKL